MGAEVIRKVPTIFYGWWIVGASVTGVALCQTPVIFLTLGVFMKPLGEAFGWGRDTISFGLSVAVISVAIATPLSGRLIDRWGARAVLLPSLGLYAVITASLFFLTSSLWHFYIVFALIGIVGAGSNTMTYVRILTAWFDRHRGMAMGFAMAGVGLGTAIAPMIAQRLIDVYDWRIAYMGLGLMIVVVGLPIIYLFIRNTPQEMGLMPDGTPSGEKLAGEALEGVESERSGLTRSEAFRTRAFWVLVTMFFLVATSLHGIQIHLVPLLSDRGLSSTIAASSVGVMGLSTIAGRIGVGFLFDHFFAPKVAIIVFIFPIIAMLVLSMTSSILIIYLCAVLLGVGAGAESDLLGYLASRYFGLRSLGELYGYIFSAFMLGTAIGPFFVGFSYELTGSYHYALWISSGLVVVVCGLLATLEPFPQLSKDKGVPIQTASPESFKPS